MIAVRPKLSKIRVGLIGLGMISKNHLSAYQKIGEIAEIVAVADVRKELVQRTAKEVAAESYYDYRELLQDDKVDAVDIMLPHNLHLQAAVDAAAAGKDIFIEKPLARTAAEATKIVEATDRAGVRLMIGNNLLFHPGVQKARELIEKKYLGKIVLESMVIRVVPLQCWYIQVSKVCRANGGW